MAPEQALVYRTALAVTFHLAEQRYALALDAVLQVVQLPDLTILAGAPAVVCGLLNLHGQFIPVLDGRVLVGAEPACGLDSSILVLADDGRPTLGLLTDEVEAVREFPPGSLTRVANSASFIAGLLRDGEGTAILLEPAALQMAAHT